MFGICYHYALETFFDIHSGLSSGTVMVGSTYGAFDGHSESQPYFQLPQLGDTPRLVHGFVVGESGETKDLKFGHAWLEGNGLVVDCGSKEKSHALVHREHYYEFWRINPEECHHYTIQQAIEHILRTGCVSGWHPAPSDAITVEIKSDGSLLRNFPSPATSRPPLRA